MMIRRRATCRCVRTPSSLFKMNQTSLEKSSLVMRRGFLSSTRKPSARALSERVWHRWGQRKQDSQSQKSKSCLSQSLMWEASSTVSSCHRTRWSISKSTERSYGVRFTQCVRRDESCGRANCGSFTTTTNKPSASPLPQVLGREENCCAGTISLFTWPCSEQLFSFSQAQGGHQGNPFWRPGGHQESCNNGAEGHSRRILPAVHRSMAEKDGNVH